MTKIWNEAGFVADDPWVIETEETKAGSNEKAILGIEAFLARVAERDESGLGVLISPADDVRRLEGHLDRIALIAVAFPAFSDGRSFSKAELLRGRHGFAGAVRATGQVLVDQIAHMLRVGFDEFEVSHPVLLRRLEDGKVGGLGGYYQPAARQAPPGPSYAWRRLPAA